jgi:uncharacterized protein YacL
MPHNPTRCDKSRRRRQTDAPRSSSSFPQEISMFKDLFSRARTRLENEFALGASSSSVILWLLRGFFGAIMIGIGYIAFDFFSREEPRDWVGGTVAFIAILGISFLVVATDLLVRNKQITTISAVYFGLLMGLLLGSLLSMALEPIVPREWVESRTERIELPGQRGAGDPMVLRLELPPDAKAADKKQEEPIEPKDGEPKAGNPPSLRDLPGARRHIDLVGQRSATNPAVVQYQLPTGQKPPQMQVIRLILTLICCYICISLLLQTKDEFRFIIPYVEFSKQIKGGKPLVLDTSVIIDGRIADICDTRFIDAKLIVPRFVLQELQGIADSSDKLKRNRGRRGLDMLKRMQTNPKVELQLHEGNLSEMRDVQKVDERLVVLAKALGARVVTNDFNLNKIAQLQGVEVINLNELSNALKSVALPGETMNVRLVRQGDQIGQGVGYLDDGTMVVVEQGRQYIGQDMVITVTSVLQTSAGRMIFGRVEPKPAPVGVGDRSARAESPP